MNLACPSDRLRLLLDFPWELQGYERFVGAQSRSGRSTNDMFSEEIARFEPRPEDVLVAVEDLAVTRSRRGVALSSECNRAEIEVPNLSYSDAVRLLGAIDGTRRAAEIAWEGGDVEQLLRSTFGLVVFAPQAVETLERGLSGIEITRFPGSPYGIVRPYWENMLAVRRALEERLGDALQDYERSLVLLRELHILATLGSSLTNFYKPSSPVSDAGVEPGALWNVPARTVATARGTLFVSGPRVNASAPAGELYHRLIYHQVGDGDATEGERDLTDPDGLGWGRLLVARAAHDDRFAPWFCPPRPLEARHFERLLGELRDALGAAGRQDNQACIAHAARFHWRFVHLHPFRCANQCLAMNIINYVLRQVLPSGIPHLLLDQLSVRLRIEPYQRLFARAVASFVCDQPNPALSYGFYRDRKRLAFRAMQRLSEASSEAEARATVRAHPEEAHAALLDVG